jgi:Acetyltransferase (GNAT) domain
MSGLALRVQPVESRAALEAEWRAFEARVGPGFFLSSAWIGAWLATLPPALPLYRVAAHRDGEIAGLAVLAANTVRAFLRAPSRGLHLNAAGDERWDCIAIEHNGFLAAPNQQSALIAALGAWFAAGAGGLGDELRLPGVAAGLSSDFLDRHRLLHSTQTRTGFAVDLGRVRAAGDFAALLSGNARQQLRRAQRDFAQDGAVAITEADDRGEALAYFAALKELHVRSWGRRGQRHAFVEPYFETFHRALIEREFARGAIQLLRVTVADRAIGYLYNFRHGGRISAYQSGFDTGDRSQRRFGRGGVRFPRRRESAQVQLRHRALRARVAGDPFPASQVSAGIGGASRQAAAVRFDASVPAGLSASIAAKAAISPDI